MKTKELRALAGEELQSNLQELRKELLKENAQVAVGRAPKSPGKIRAMRRDIARVITLLHEKEIQKGKAQPRQPPVQSTAATAKPVPTQKEKGTKKTKSPNPEVQKKV